MNEKHHPSAGKTDERHEPLEPTSAREKVLRHLRTAVVAGTGLALACSGPSGGGAQQTAPADQPKEGPPIVCDPLPPPPLTCTMSLTTDDIRSLLRVEAQTITTEQGLAIAITLSTDGWRQLPGLKISGDPKIQSAKQVSKERHENLLKITCLPEKGKKTFQITVPMTCAVETFSVDIDVAVPGKVVEKQRVEVSISLR